VISYSITDTQTTQTDATEYITPSHSRVVTNW